MGLAIKLAESGNLPDSIVRQGIKQLVKQRLAEISANNCETGMAQLTQFIAAMNQSEIAPVPELANAQHYEVPAAFFHYCLGKHRKYSSCFWMTDTQTLDEAETLALSQTCHHADLQDGQAILELGCGWGSLSLWMAAQYPKSTITGVS
ncbi:MAG: class I SAM-dependent methyltransferase, partial [Pseudomonadota bacterium]